MDDRVFGRRVLVSRNNLEEARVDDAGEPTLQPGQACFAIERVALSANNMTCALLGDMMGYWRFFPAPDGWGGLPVWGVGRCVASEADGVEEGQRVFGFWPLAERLVVDVKANRGGFADPAPHRQGLSDFYNSYEHREAADEAAGIEAAFRPLFMTGWLLDRWIAIEEDFGADQIVLTSASSKTSMSMAWTHSRRKDGPKLIGLTSKKHVDFVRGLALYDEVRDYDMVGELDASKPTVLVDVAGNRSLRAALHTHFGDALRHSAAVGLTHGAPNDGIEVPAPESQMFFASQAIGKLQMAMGAEAFMKEAGTQWATFARQAPDLVKIEVRQGIQAARDAYVALAAGEVGGATTLIFHL